MYEDFNDENEEPSSHQNFRFRERFNKRKDNIIIEEESDNE